MSTHDLTLSPEAAQRRDAMREELMDAFVTMHRKRRLRRQITAPVLIFAVVAAAAWALRPSPTPSRAPVAAAAPLVEVVEGAAAGSVVDFQWVAQGRSSVVESVESTSMLVQTIDDDQLVQTLAQMNRPAGLIEIGGSVRLTRSVADEEHPDPADRDSRIDIPSLPRNTHPSHGV